MLGHCAPCLGPCVTIGKHLQGLGRLPVSSHTRQNVVQPVLWWSRCTRWDDQMNTFHAVLLAHFQYCRQLQAESFTAEASRCAWHTDMMSNSFLSSERTGQPGLDQEAKQTYAQTKPACRPKQVSTKRLRRPALNYTRLHYTNLLINLLKTAPPAAGVLCRRHACSLIYALLFPNPCAPFRSSERGWPRRPLRETDTV